MTYFLDQAIAGTGHDAIQTVRFFWKSHRPDQRSEVVQNAPLLTTDSKRD